MDFLEDSGKEKSTNDFIKSYLKTLPLPAKHFIIYALKEGIVWESLALDDIASMFSMTSAEVAKIYQEAEVMLDILCNNNKFLR